MPTSVGSQKKQESYRKISSAFLTTPKHLTVWITTNYGKFLKRWDYQTTWPASWEADQEATVRTGHGTTDWFQIRKGVRQGCIFSYHLFNLYVEYTMWNTGQDKTQAGIKIVGRNINNLRYADDTTFMAESKEELKSFLMKVKEKSEKNWLKAQHLKNKDQGIQSHHFMTNRWGNSGNSERLYFGGLQSHHRWWRQPWNYTTLVPWMESYDQTRQHIKKQRHYFANKGPSSQSYSFFSSHVWTWELNYKESWVMKNWCF